MYSGFFSGVDSGQTDNLSDEQRAVSLAEKHETVL
jgi:asparagine synthetase A